MMIGLFGHNLINPGCVGGDLVMEAGTLEDTELYVRWWQFAVFMPVLQVSHCLNELHPFLHPYSIHHSSFTM